MTKQIYRHWVPASPIREDHPFVYSTKALPKDTNITYEEYFKEHSPNITLTVLSGTPASTLMNKIRREIMRVFPFHIYLDENSPLCLNNKDNKGPSYSVKIEQFVLKEIPPTGKRKTTKTVQEVISTIGLLITDFKSDYRFTLVKSIDQLNSILENKDVIAFDTETTGLNPDIDYIVGISLCTEPKRGYYVPIAHSQEYASFNLGHEALQVIHKYLLEAKHVPMFNSRFDMRMLEYTKDPSGYDYSLDDINLFDTQISAYFADPEYSAHDLKTLEKHFLGYTRDDLKTVLSTSSISEYNFSLIDPQIGLFYAAQDAISTHELFLETYQFHKEFGVAGLLDQKLLFILMRLENHAMRLDREVLFSQLTDISSRLAILDAELREHIGDINLNSSKQKAALLQSFGLNTEEKTKAGSMATGTKAIIKMIDRLKEEGKDYPKWLELFEERTTLDKLVNTFFGSLAKQIDDNAGRIRINYRLGVTSTGRLSSGKEELE